MEICGDYMSRKRASIPGKIGWGVLADILLFVTALVIMSIFAFMSFSNAYFIALFILAIVLAAFTIYRVRKRRLMNKSPDK